MLKSDPRVWKRWESTLHTLDTLDPSVFLIVSSVMSFQAPSYLKMFLFYKNLCRKISPGMLTCWWRTAGSLWHWRIKDSAASLALVSRNWPVSLLRRIRLTDVFVPQKRHLYGSFLSNLRAEKRHQHSHIKYNDQPESRGGGGGREREREGERGGERGVERGQEREG